MRTIQDARRTLLYAVNDALSAIAAEHSLPSDDYDIDNATHAAVRCLLNEDD